MDDPNTNTPMAVLTIAARQLGDEGRAEAELLLCHLLGCSRAWLVAHGDDELAPGVVADFANLVARRARGEPVAQIVGHRGFWSLDLRITPDVLIPRPETELLVERALRVLPANRAVRVADLGAGSGAIALAIASERPLAAIVAVDQSMSALEVMRGNAKTLGVSGRVRCLHGDWFGPLRGERFDAIVSNPPYIAAGDPHLHEGDLRFEPIMALVSGCDGLDAIRAIVRDAPDYLEAGGWLMLEHGWQQDAAVRKLLETSGFIDVATHKDLGGRERVTEGRLGPR